MSFLVQCTSFSSQKGTRNKTSSFFMKANLCPILPYGCQPLMSNRIILFERVLNSFVQPTHSGVPPLLLSRVMPYKICLSGFALLCHCLESTPVIQHQLNPWRTLSATVCAFLFYAASGLMMSFRNFSSSKSQPVCNTT